ncbi:MAG: twin-arginine translocase subunit TatC, partial [Luteolibacter sp.]
MNLLHKIIQLRESSHPDHEKPFLEHLEDLRIMITRIFITLVVSMVMCFGFQQQLMELLRRPVEQVWITQLDAKLPKSATKIPKPLNVEIWESAKRIEHAASGLDNTQREVFYKNLGDSDLVFHARSVALLRALLDVPENRRKAFLEGLDVRADLRKQVEVLA